MSIDLIKHVSDLRVPPQGVEYVRQAMASPSRLVNNTRYLNVTTRFASFKMGEVIQSESHTCELPFLCQLELDDDVVAVYDQPPPLFVEFPDSRGRLHRGNKTPDFLVVRRQRVEIYECKPGDVLRDLAKDKPHTWSYDEGAFRYFPAEKPAHELGFEFLVHNGDDISAVLATNLKLLVNVRRAKIAPLDERQLAKACRLLCRRRAWTLRDLAEALRIEDVSPIIASILAGNLFALTRWQPLSTIEGAFVYASRGDADAAESLLITAAECDCLNGHNFQAPLALSPKAMTYTKRAIEVVRQVRSGDIKPDRKAYRLMAKLRLATDGQPLLQVLSPAFYRRGARKSLGPEIEEVIAHVIRESYTRVERPSISAAYIILLQELEERGLTRISYETFRQRVKARPKHALLLERQGVRAANAARPPVLPDDSAILATYAWERAHIDSTLLDEETWLSCPLSEVLARPTIYILVDECSSKILAYWCCFANAGRQALACLLRDCIRRHQKLPCSIVHDLGPEFLSVFHETFNATFLIDLNRRPSRAPRWGAHVESAFNRINKLIAHRLSGNTLNDRLGCAGDAKHRGRAHAKHDLMDLLEIIESGLMDWLNNRPTGENIASPNEIFEASAEYFSGLARPAPITSEILAHTAIPDGTRLIDQSRGISYKHRRYFGHGINHPSLHGKKVEIRWEPYNPGILYAQVNNAWQRLTTHDFARYEHAGHSYHLAQLYLSHDTAGASRRARQDADLTLAAKQHLDLVTKAKNRQSEPHNPVPVQQDIFEQARLIDFESLELEVSNGD